jgi:hypothetical protein
MSRMTHMRSWKSHRVPHIHGKALIHKLTDLSLRIVVPLVYLFLLYGSSNMASNKICLLLTPYNYPQNYLELVQNDRKVKTMWVSSHGVIAGNERARIEARQATLDDLIYCRPLMLQQNLKKWPENLMQDVL